MTKNPMEQSNTSLAAWLRVLRLRVGYSQQNVADILNVNRSTYTYYETGKTSPDPVTLNRIAKIFNVPLELFFREEEPTAVLGDSGVVPKRSPKKAKFDPSKIGELSSGEKDIVAFLRDKGLSAEDVLQALKGRFGDTEAPKVDYSVRGYEKK